MKKKTILLLIPLLFSCSAKNAPKEITSFLNACSLNKAREECKTIRYSLSSTIKESDKEKGSTSLLIEYDNSKEDFYEYQKEEYTLDNIIKEDSYQLYVTKKEKFTYLTKENTYEVKTIYTGYKDEENKKENTVCPSPIRYNKDSVEELKKTLFSSYSSKGINSGGIYFADFFSSNLSYYPYMSIQNDEFFFRLENYPFKNESEEGFINEEIVMNSLGLLKKMTQNATNTTTKKSSHLFVDVEYNQKINRKEVE